MQLSTKDEIEKTLDVNGKDFDELLGNESDWASNLGEAHSKSYKQHADVHGQRQSSERLCPRERATSACMWPAWPPQKSPRVQKCVWVGGHCFFCESSYG